jgi:tetratricopeptide (TPR) repeat protein
MSNEETLTRRDLKTPDKFQESATRAVNWMTANKKAARMLGLALLAVVAAGLVAGIASGRRADRAGALAYEVLRAVGAQVSAVPSGKGDTTFATDAERQRAVIAEADRTLAEYPSTPSGRLALLMKADAQYRLGETDAAIAGYERYLAEVPAGGALRFGALQGIALALEAKGKLDEASTAWDRAGREAPAFADRAELERARVLRAAGKADEARKLLDGFETRHKGTELAAEAAERLATASGK